MTSFLPCALLSAFIWANIYFFGLSACTKVGIRSLIVVEKKMLDFQYWEDYHSRSIPWHLPSWKTHRFIITVRKFASILKNKQSYKLQIVCQFSRDSIALLVSDARKQSSDGWGQSWRKLGKAAEKGQNIKKRNKRFLGLSTYRHFCNVLVVEGETFYVEKSFLSRVLMFSYEETWTIGLE